MLTTNFPTLRMKGQEIDMKNYVTGLIDTYMHHNNDLLKKEVTRLRSAKFLGVGSE